MLPEQIKEFLDKYAVGNYTEAEHFRFIDWVKKGSMEEVNKILEVYPLIMTLHAGPEFQADQQLVREIEAALDQYELGKAARHQTFKMSNWRQFYKVAAALILFALSAAVFHYLTTTTTFKPPAIAKVQKANQAINPGTNKAILTLADGSTIVLDDGKNGTLAIQGGTQVTKMDNGRLVYKLVGENPVEVVYNTLTTPKGGQFKLKLPDGSEVWLNAESSITYPNAFNSKERKVEITGEAYFEIAHDITKPFKVAVNGLEVRVLGTHFNVNGYKDEADSKITLLEGSIRLEKGGSSTQLKVGQQARLSKANNLRVLNNVDLEQVVAWKNGYFSFNHDDLKTVMRQISRWYDVDVVYEGKVPDRQFGGKIDRNSSAVTALKILKESKVNFRIDGKKIIVEP